VNRLLKIIINPFFLSLVFSSVIIFLLPPLFNKYELKLNLKTILEQQVDFFYNDLDGDNFSEQIDNGSNSKGFARLYIRNNKGLTIDQWNFDHKYIPMGNKIFVSDVNNDGKKEVFVFTFDNDSIFLNAVDPLGTGTYLFQNRFITKINDFKKEPDFSISKGYFADLNNDRFKEIIFAINAGFSLFPRKLFAYDYKNDTLLSSVECGNVLSDINAADLNNDGIPEILTNTWAPRNYTDSTLKLDYHDTSTYLMVFDNKLDFFFPPIEYKHSIGDIINHVIKTKDKSYILSVHRILGQSQFKSALYLLNINGKVIRKAILPEINSPISKKYGHGHIANNQIIITSKTGEVFYYNFNLELIDKKKLPINDLVYPNYFFMDLNSDGQDEVITFDADKRIIIVDKNLKHPVTFKFETETNPWLSLKYNGDAPPTLIAINGKQIWFFNYRLNLLYYWHYPIYFTIFSIILLINLLIKKLQKTQLQKKFDLQQQVAELQLKTIKNQMEPHFMFNALNSIASAIYDKDKDVVYNYFVKVSRLVRKTLDDSNKITRTVEEELNFVKDYLDVEKIRFGDKINYKIYRDSDVSLQWTIPKMLVQIYVENAVKHGIMHKQNGGLIKIILNTEDNYLVFKIVDNGIGRKKAQEIGSKSTGKGQIIIKQYYALYSRKSKLKIEQNTIDLKDIDGNPAGTKVVIKVPINN